jgi:hypothetical protein
MTRGLGLTKRTRIALAIAAMVFVGLRAFVPQGYMIGHAADGSPTIEICTDQGLQTIHIDPATGKVVPGDGQHHSDNPCPFAVAAVAAFFALPALPVQETPTGQPAYILAPKALLSGFTEPAPPARGPPLSA